KAISCRYTIENTNDVPAKTPPPMSLKALTRSAYRHIRHKLDRGKYGRARWDYKPAASVQNTVPCCSDARLQDTASQSTVKRLLRSSTTRIRPGWEFNVPLRFSVYSRILPFCSKTRRWDARGPDPAWETPFFAAPHRCKP